MVEQQPNSGTPENEASSQITENASQQSEAPHRLRTVETRLNELIESLAAERQRPGFDLVAESYLSRLGVREPLIASGILPPEDPNPHVIDTEPEAYAQWWDEHPDIDPWTSQKRYEETLSTLYIGARIGFLAGTHLDRVPLTRIEPDISTEQ